MAWHDSVHRIIRMILGLICLGRMIIYEGFVNRDYYMAFGGFMWSLLIFGVMMWLNYAGLLYNSQHDGWGSRYNYGSFV